MFILIAWPGFVGEGEARLNESYDRHRMEEIADLQNLDDFSPPNRLSMTSDALHTSRFESPHFVHDFRTPALQTIGKRNPHVKATGKGRRKACKL